MAEPNAAPSIAVVDVETTGLFPSRHDRIVEIGIVVIQLDGTAIKEFESLVNPMRDIGPTSVHGLTSESVMEAPVFRDIAGHVLDALRGTVALAGHNVRFDNQFLQAEFSRIGCEWPQCPLLCTMQLSGGGSLEECCSTFGVSAVGMRHNALADAQCSSKLLAALLQDEPKIAAGVRALDPVEWPRFDGVRSPPLTRRASNERIEGDITYIQRLLRRREFHALPAATDGATLAYGALLDRALEDRRLDDLEAESLIDVATQWGLDNARVERAHREYLEQLIVVALADGRVSDAELGDLRRVARLLGQNKASLDSAIADALVKLGEPRLQRDAVIATDQSLRGLKVCFTGELQKEIAGKRISREMAESLAAAAGMIVVGTVTKNCDLLVLADPSSQSGKAKRARALGVRIMHESVFWKQVVVAE